MQVRPEVPLLLAGLEIDRVKTVVTGRKDHEVARDGGSALDVVLGGEGPDRPARAGVDAVETAREVVV